MKQQTVPIEKRALQAASLIGFAICVAVAVWGWQSGILTSQEKLQELVAQNNLADKVELAATFCTGNCQKGVCVTIDEQLYSVSPETAATFFETEVLPKVSA